MKWRHRLHEVLQRSAIGGIIWDGNDVMLDGEQVWSHMITSSLASD